MANKFKTGARVWYIVHPFGQPDTRTAGTVINVIPTPGAPTEYRVRWDNVNYAAGFIPAPYHAADLCPVNDYLAAVADAIGIHFSEFDAAERAMIDKAKRDGLAPDAAADGVLALIDA
jgi:hypothetical protein